MLELLEFDLGRQRGPSKMQRFGWRRVKQIVYYQLIVQVTLN